MKAVPTRQAKHRLPNKRFRHLGLTLAIALAAAPAAFAQYGTAAKPLGDSLTDESIPEVGISQNLGKQLPLDATFRNELNQPVTLEEIFAKGQPVIVQLGYFECPMLCGEVLNGMLESLDQVDYTIGDDFQVVSISIDSEETPSLAGQKKHRYVEAYGRDADATSEGWHFLVGDEEAIGAVTRATGFGFEYLPQEDEFAHASAIMVATPGGELSRYFFGVQYPPEGVRMALLEASEGNIGGLVDAVILRCYLYDSTTGQYTLSIMRVVRLAGLATVALIVVFVVAMVIWDRRRKANRQATSEHVAMQH